eukprot:358674-Chlamydomonas_euryale.AAC.6
MQQFCCAHWSPRCMRYAPSLLFDKASGWLLELRLQPDGLSEPNSLTCQTEVLSEQSPTRWSFCLVHTSVIKPNSLTFQTEVLSKQSQRRWSFCLVHTSVRLHASIQMHAIAVLTASAVDVGNKHGRPLMAVNMQPIPER